uniref:Uncharacterized protein n=1 Tax=Triticum urartu TaxID=4572 RepID=A0A8R7UK87_TRIUA
SPGSRRSRGGRGRRSQGWARQAEPRPPLSSPVERRIKEASAPPPPSRLLSYIGHTTPRSWSRVAEARRRLRRSEESLSGHLLPPRKVQAQPPRHQLHPISVSCQGKDIECMALPFFMVGVWHLM